MLYNEIVGQQEAKSRLQKMFSDDRVPHALLLSGREGSGNLALSLAFAGHLFCREPLPHTACGKCHTCVMVSKLTHPDLHLVFPIAKSKYIRSSDDLVKEFRAAFLDNPYLTLNQWFDEISAENKQPLIPVEEANEILRKLSYTSFEGGKKVMIIWQPEKMNADSANKLLKILEEPPDDTVFILAASQPDQLLATIRSRVQQIPLRHCSDNEIAENLIKQFGIGIEAANEAAIMSDGNYGEAVNILSDQETSVSFLLHFQTFMRLALKFDCGKGLEWIDENAARGREGQKQFLQYSLEVFRDALMYNFGNKDLVRLSGKQKEFLEKFAPFVTSRNYEALVKEFNDSFYYIERNANPKILFMDLLLRTNELINTR